MQHNILVVEDDVELAAMIDQFLIDEGFNVDVVHDGDQAIDKIFDSRPDLVLLDIMLPGTPGIEVVRQVRRQYQGIIIMLTAKNDDITEVNSLNRGADDYLEKPVRPHILLAHIKAHLRRSTYSNAGSESAANNQKLNSHNLYLDMNKHEAFVDGEPLNLTTAELQLLSYFIIHAGQVVTRDDLYRHLRNIEYDGMARSMDMRISALRKKMGDERPPYRYIKTVRGQGYILSK